MTSYVVDTEKILEQAVQWSDNTMRSVGEFKTQLDYWYQQFQQGECTLSFAAQKLGMNKVDLMHILDELGLPVSNM